MVGSLIAFVVFLNNVMAGSASRFFAVSIGSGDTEETNRWFNTSLGIHLGLAGLLVLAGWPIGEYAVKHILKIPPDRVQTCILVFRISLVSAFLSMASVPFTAMFTAKQHIAELAFWGVAQSILAFALAYSLRMIKADLLLVYAFGMVGILALILVVRIVRGIFVFPECKIDVSSWLDRTRMKRMFSFSGWTMIGMTGALLRDHGSAFLLNLHFGPAMNAAYGIATQVSSQVQQLASAMLGAFAPEINASEGRGERTRMLRLADQASKFGTLMVLFFAIPLMMEMDYVLALWLKSPPVHAAAFCKLILATFLIDRLSTGNMLAVNALGRVAAYQATVGSCLVMTLPLAWLFLRMGLPPASVGWAFVATMTATSIGRVLWTRRFFAVPVNSWLRNVVFPCALVASGAAISIAPLQAVLPTGILRLVAVSVSSGLLAAGLIWKVALTRSEKEFFASTAKKTATKLGIATEEPR